MHTWALTSLQNIWPMKEERLKNALLFHGKIVVIILDGVEQQIVEHIDARSKLTRSGKKSYHTVTKLVGVNPYGVPMLISYIPCADLSICQMQEVLSLLKELGPEESVGGDPAFIDLDDMIEASLVVAYKSSKNMALTDEEKKYTDFKILRYTFRSKGDISSILKKHDQVFYICAALMKQYLFIDGTKMIPVDHVYNNK